MKTAIADTAAGFFKSVKGYGISYKSPKQVKSTQTDILAGFNPNATVTSYGRLFNGGEILNPDFLVTRCTQTEATKNL